MRRRTGAILRDSRPAMIIRSDCRGDPRKTSAPNRAMSYRPQLIAIISMAQHARPNVTGQMAERRAHCTIFSTVVVRTGISISAMPLAAPIERAFAPDVDIARQQQREERDDLPEAGLAQIAEGDRPGIEKRDLDVEEQEDHRHEIELDGLPFARIADRWHAALVRRRFFRGGLARAQKLRQQDGSAGKTDAQTDHDEDGQKTVHVRRAPGPGAELVLRWIKHNLANAPIQVNAGSGLVLQHLTHR